MTYNYKFVMYVSYYCNISAPPTANQKQGAKPALGTTAHSQPGQETNRSNVTDPRIGRQNAKERPAVITGTATDIANGDSGLPKKHIQPGVMSIEEAKASLQRERSDEDSKYGDLGTGRSPSDHDLLV